MDRSAVAVNYASVLLALAEREQALDQYASLIHAVADQYRDTPEFRRFLETPRISVDEKKQVIRQVFGGATPELFLRFLLIVIEKRRFRLLPEIDLAYREQVDEKEGRVRASVTLARPPDSATREEVSRQLSGLLDRKVIATYKEDRELLGGIVIRVGDQIMDGSVRRRLRDLRHTLREPHAV
jgi:F-type H+-transporting ATPase subunit delta